MNFAHAVILGIVEGLTEFLPISSTGHLILTAKLLGLPQTEFLKSFEISIQVGAIFAVATLYGKTFLTDRPALWRVLTAFLPTAVAGFLLHKIIKQFLFSGTGVVLWSLFLGGIILLAFDRCHSEKENCVKKTSDIPPAKAFGIGLIQSLAMVPGVSRSGATVVGGMLLGLDRKTTVEFSFLLAAPTLLAATALDIWKNGSTFDPSAWSLLLVGALVSFIVALVSMKFFLKFVQQHKHGFAAFGIYRIGVALVFWALVK